MPIDKAGRQIAGLLTYNPGPGIYSRLERAIQAMPENVRAQELPGLLKRYKDGVPGWELKATDLDSVIAGRDVVPREELLGAVRERSPVYTHGEVVLGGTPPKRPAAPDGSEGDYDVPVLVRQRSQSPLGGGVSHGEPLYSNYGQGGSDYTELLLTQPGHNGIGFGSHWSGTGKPQDQAVAHARYDTHGDALRINELQSDLGIHNRKARESLAEEMRTGRIRDSAVEQPFPLEDAWSDLLIKRMALEAARQGHRAIEVASPRAIADKVGGNIDNYEHFYGKVVPGALERLGRKMGGLTPDSPPQWVAGYDEVADEIFKRYEQPTGEALKLLVDARKEFRGAVPAFAHTPGDRFDMLAHSYREDQAYIPYMAKELHQGIIDDMVARGADDAVAQQRAGALMPRLMRLAEDQATTATAYRKVRQLGHAQDEAGLPVRSETRRYLMSDEMRRRLIQEGVGAAVAGGLMSQDDLIERLGQ